MPQPFFRFLSVSAATVVVLGVFCTAIPDAEAGERSRSGSYTTGSGRSGTIDATRDAHRGEGVTRNKNIQSDKGKGAVVGSHKTYTKGEGVQKETGVTTNSGNSYDFSATRGYDRDTGHYSGTTTGQNGKSITNTGTAGDGQRSGSYETSGGRSGSYDTSISKTEEGLSKEKSVTTDGGKTYDSRSLKTYDRDSHTLSGNRTGARGKVRGGSISYQYNR
ncbi:MAG: hypothetical protein ACK4PK_04060 [Alphaproteobacteria bacterium]